MSEKAVLRIGEAINVVKKDGESLFECARCGHSYGSTAMGDPKKESIMREISIGDLNSWNKYGWVDEFVVREFYCPKCGVMIAANMQRKDEDIMMDFSLNLT
ncbi:MAG: acetone carboxylase subunit gamma [Chloroflexota bacterium]